MQHIDDVQLDSYASGLLSEPLLAETEEHLLICPQCQERLVQADEFAALFRQAVQEPAPSRAAWWNLRPAWAGALAVVAIAAIVVPMQLREGPPSTIELRSVRGPESSVHAASRKPLRLVFDVPATEAGQVRVVDLAGNQIAEASSGSDGGRTVAQVHGLPKGTYWVRIYAKSDPSALLSEYALLTQ